MTLNDMYTAMSRGTALSHVHLEYTDKTFETPKPTTETWLIPLMKGKEGGLYMARNESHVYVGQVKNHARMADRWAEHCDSKAIMDESWTWIDMGRFLYWSESELNKAEERAIVHGRFDNRTLVNVHHAKLREQRSAQKRVEARNLLNDMVSIKTKVTGQRYRIVVMVGSSVVARKDITGRKSKEKAAAWIDVQSRRKALEFLC